MSPSAWQDYISSIRSNLSAGNATEHTYRPALKVLVEAIRSNIVATNEPRREACGAPDYVVTSQLHEERLVVGYVEAKDIGVSLDHAENSDQLLRYRNALPNLILTDYLDFRWYVDGELRQSARVARIDRRGRISEDKKEIEAAEQILQGFLDHTPAEIKSPETLALRMARLTHMIRDIIVQAFDQERASNLLWGWRNAFAQVLISDLDQPENTEQFSDMFAQTLAYGLFSARIMDTTPGFSKQEAQHLIPPTNPFLRDFFYQITGPQMDDEPYAIFVDDLVNLLAHTDMDAVLKNFGKRTRQEDPVVHFYETFLAAYDPDLRERRGVYYTPEPAVSYIVRSVNQLLKIRFRCHDGLADSSIITITNTDPNLNVKGRRDMRKTTKSHKVLILDPTCGTGTFLYAIIDLIREQYMRSGNAGMWSGYVREHLLPRIFGFELLMAPYAVAHFKLGLQLAGLDLNEEKKATWAYDFNSDERIGIYLTNTLEGAHEYTGLPLFTQFVADETNQANKIKSDLPIMVVIGNPPYSGHSYNKGEWIGNLLRGKLPDGERTENYYEVDGKPLGERNPKWLQDDYVKFIRWSQWRINKTGSGILAFVTNHGYLDNVTFRGMRQSLMDSFTDIYVLDLHGSTKWESPPTGITDENVFDIQKGVAIGLFVKEPNKEGPARVHHLDIWGSRQDKYSWLLEHDVETTDWEALTPKSPYYDFIPRNLDLQEEYQQGWRIDEVFPTNSMGIATARDNFTIHWNPTEVDTTIKRFIDLPPEKAREQFSLGRDARDWKVHLAQRDIHKSGPDQDLIMPISYRPFDIRFTYYTGRTRGFICMPRPEVMQNLVEGDNIALCFVRKSRQQITSNFYIAQHIVDKTILSSADNAHVAPLYRYPQIDNQEIQNRLFDEQTVWSPDNQNRIPNLNTSFVSELANRLGLQFISSGPGDLIETFGPEEILYYIYAIFYSPKYRERYAEFIKTDFPRVPITSNPEVFQMLCALGQKLIALHLLDASKVPELLSPVTRYPVPGDSKVGPRHPRYEEEHQRIYINEENENKGREAQYFEGVSSEVWEFQLGGYQVLEKWLKDRRGKLLSHEELTTYQRIVVALKETIRLMEEIDEVISKWPIR